MKQRFCMATGAAIVLGMTVGVFAQQYPSSAQSAQSMGKSVTVTGCVEKAEATPTGTTGGGEATGASAEPKFILTKASVDTTATAGTTGTTAAPTAASEYRLDSDEAKLSPHVGHKVEITGTVEQPTSAEKPASAANAPKLKVETVKMLASTCAE
jgi:hypothetical protein